MEILNPASPENGFSYWRLRLKLGYEKVAAELKNEYVIGLSIADLGKGRASFFRNLKTSGFRGGPSKSNTSRIPVDAIR